MTTDETLVIEAFGLARDTRAGRCAALEAAWRLKRMLDGELDGKTRIFVRLCRRLTTLYDSCLPRERATDERLEERFAGVCREFNRFKFEE